MAFLFNNFFWDRLPRYYHEEDTYKNVGGRGLLERYLEIFGLELDNSIIPYLEDFLDEVDPKTASNNFLTHIAYSLGSPLDIFNDASKFALLLQYIISIYKIKGTICSYEIYFKILGLNVHVIEHFDNTEIYYDSGVLYDTDLILYDSYCELCSEYSLFFKSINQPCISGSAPNLGSAIVLTPDANWTVNLLTIVAGKVHSATNNSANYARQNVITPGQLYKITFTSVITNTFAPTLNLRIGGSLRTFSSANPVDSLVYLPDNQQVVTYMFAGGTNLLEVNYRSLNAVPGGSFAELSISIQPVTVWDWDYVLTPELQATLEKVVCFLEPIDAVLREMQEQITACETIPQISAEQIKIDTLSTSLTDDGLNYDDANLYDLDTVVATQTINIP